MYSRPKQTTPVPSPAKAKGVLYFDQFASNFLKPYGLASDVPDDETLEKRANHRSCEWLLRPGFGMSEFAATLADNVSFLENEKIPFLKKKNLQQFFEDFKQYLPSLHRLNNKNEEKAEQEDVTQVLRMLFDEESSINDTMALFFKVGGAMFTTSIQYFVAQQLLSNPKRYALRMAVQDDDRCEQFKTTGDLKSMRDMFVSICAKEDSDPSSTRKRGTSSRKQLFQELGQMLPHESDDSQPSTSGLTQQDLTPNPPKSKRCKIEDSPSDDDDDDDDDTSTTVKRTVATPVENSVEKLKKTKGKSSSKKR